MDKTDPLQNPNRAKELLAEAGESADPAVPPKRVRSFLTYSDNPEEVIEVPYTTAGDVMAAEEVLGKGVEPYMKLALKVSTEGWMIWRALSRHPEERHRPKEPFASWREKVEQIWSDRDADSPLGAGDPKSPPLSYSGG